MKKLILLIFVIISLSINLNLTSAVVVNSVSVDSLSPGQEGTIRIEIENIFEEDVTDVSISLDFTNTPFTPIGNSEDGIDELNEGGEEDFVFRFKASNDASPGDYQILYKIEFKKDDKIEKREGTLGVTVQANTELSYSVSTETPVIGKEGKITLKVINKGFSDAKFVLVRVIPEGYTLLSEDEVYIGGIAFSDKTENFITGRSVKIIEN